MVKKGSRMKLVRADLEIQVEQLSKNLEIFSGKVEQFSGMLASLQRSVQSVQDFVGRAVFPAKALGDLTGELRALRHLWDKEGKYAFMDRPQEERVGDGAKVT